MRAPSFLIIYCLDLDILNMLDLNGRTLAAQEATEDTWPSLKDLYRPRGNWICWTFIKWSLSPKRKLNMLDLYWRIFVTREAIKYAGSSLKDAYRPRGKWIRWTFIEGFLLLYRQLNMLDLHVRILSTHKVIKYVGSSLNDPYCLRGSHWGSLNKENHSHHLRNSPQVINLCGQGSIKFQN